MEKEIKIAARLYELRDIAKGFFRLEYAEKLKPYIAIIKAVMKANELDELHAALKITKTEIYQENGMEQMLFLVAAVEMMEPSEEFLNQTKEQ